MLTTIIATLIVGQGVSLTCPIMNETSPAKGSTPIDYNGVRYSMCCAGCIEPFKKDPAKALKNPQLKGKLVGYSLFDPVSGLRIDAKDAKGGYSDYNGIRYYFSKAEAKKTFDGDAKKFSAAPTKEALYCPVMGHDVENYASAGGYVDLESTRYYVCCSGCMEPLKKETQKFADQAKSKVKPVAAVNAPKSK